MSQKILSLYYPNEITLKLAEGALTPPEVQVLRVGKFKHPTYGDFEITPKALAEFKKNFDEKVRRIDIAFDWFHENEKKAAGWPKALELREDGTQLWAINVEWTPSALKSLSDKEVRYFSPEFVQKFTDPETGKVYNNVLFGGGLTNRPFIKDMEPIVALAEVKPTGNNDKKGIKKMDEKDKQIEELKAQIAALQKKLDQDNAADSAEQMAEKQKMLDASNADKEKLCTEIKALKEKISLSEKEAEFTVLLSEGKACAAQKDAFIKGNMKEFVEKSQPVNLSESGSGKGGDNKGAAIEEQVIKLAEEKCAKNKALSLPSAMSEVLRENRDLAAKYEAAQE